MAGWPEVQQRIHGDESPYDRARRDGLEELSNHTGRNTIAYYSGWLDKGDLEGLGPRLSVNDSDKNAFMSTIMGLDRSLGLDLILHTPGGDVAATESLVEYLHAMFGDIRVIVPQLAMSAGTMIALSSRAIVMGKQSSLGPIDPQIGGIPAHGVIEEFKTAKQEITDNPALASVWGNILQKYPPTFIGECAKAISWADLIVEKWMREGMFRDDDQCDEKIKRVMEHLGDHASSLSHSRHISKQRARELGIVVEDLEADQKLQDAVLTVHHSAMLTLSETPTFKIVENNLRQGIVYQFSRTA